MARNSKTYEKALSLLDSSLLKDAKLIRLDDIYTPEITKYNALKKDTNYFIKSDIKTDIDGDTIVIIYIGNKDEKGKAQFFIKPEKQ